MSPQNCIGCTHRTRWLDENGPKPAAWRSAHPTVSVKASARTCGAASALGRDVAAPEDAGPVDHAVEARGPCVDRGASAMTALSTGVDNFELTIESHPTRGATTPREGRRAARAAVVRSVSRETPPRRRRALGVMAGAVASVDCFGVAASGHGPQGWSGGNPAPWLSSFRTSNCTSQLSPTFSCPTFAPRASPGTGRGGSGFLQNRL